MTTRQCKKCKLYYPDMIWSHTVGRCPFCGATIEQSKVYEHLTPEEKQAYRELNRQSNEATFGFMSLSLSDAIKFYKRYRHNRSLLLDEKRYVMEAFWKYLEKEKENSMRFEDWLFDYYLSKFEEAC